VFVIEDITEVNYTDYTGIQGQISSYFRQFSARIIFLAALSAIEDWNTFSTANYWIWSKSKFRPFFRSNEQTLFI